MLRWNGYLLLTPSYDVQYYPMLSYTMCYPFLQYAILFYYILCASSTKLAQNEIIFSWGTIMLYSCKFWTRMSNLAEKLFQERSLSVRCSSKYCDKHVTLPHARKVTGWHVVWCCSVAWSRRVQDAIGNLQRHTTFYTMLFKLHYNTVLAWGSSRWNKPTQNCECLSQHFEKHLTLIFSCKSFSAKFDIPVQNLQE